MSLTPVLANFILTEFEKVALTPHKESGILKLYCRYLDDTTVLFREGQICKYLKVFNSFHNDLCFAVDKSENEDEHFLDIKIMNNSEKKNIYVKDINSGLYINCNNNEPWHAETG